MNASCLGDWDIVPFNDHFACKISIHCSQNLLDSCVDFSKLADEKLQK